MMTLILTLILILSFLVTDDVTALEKQDLIQELLEWKNSPAARIAKENDLYPTLSDADQAQVQRQGYCEEELERFYQTKLLIEEMTRLNPNATFTTDNQFTLMTTDEFSQWVKRSMGQLPPPTLPNASDYIEYGPEDPRSLRTWADWSVTKCMGPIKNQGNCGSCAYFASVSVVESSECIYTTGILNTYSEQHPLSCMVGGGGCRGEWPVKVLDFIATNGLCEADAYPYTSGNTGEVGVCKSTHCHARHFKFNKIGYCDRTEAAYMAAIYYRPLIVLVASGNPAWKQYQGGIVEGCGSSTMDHAVVLVGYNDAEGGYWKIRNHWGSWWGEKGYIRLRRGVSGDGACRIMQYNPVFPLWIRN